MGGDIGLVGRLVGAEPRVSVGTKDPAFTELRFQLGQESRHGSEYLGLVSVFVGRPICFCVLELDPSQESDSLGRPTTKALLSFRRLLHASPTTENGDRRGSSRAASCSVPRRASRWCTSGQPVASGPPRSRRHGRHLLAVRARRQAAWLLELAPPCSSGGPGSCRTPHGARSRRSAFLVHNARKLRGKQPPLATARARPTLARRSGPDCPRQCGRRPRPRRCAAGSGGRECRHPLPPRGRWPPSTPPRLRG